jgi:hypothetical protein
MAEEKITPERKAEIFAELDAMFGPPRPKPKVVTVDAVAVRDADVHVSRADRNAEGTDRVVEVRRSDWVTINMAAYERQCAERAAERRERRALDPCRLGLYGPTDDE